MLGGFRCQRAVETPGKVSGGGGSVLPTAVDVGRGTLRNAVGLVDDCSPPLHRAHWLRDPAELSLVRISAP
ncbi:hypothetical protein MHYP_G00257680 [Metynnis hypsauchen]